METAFNLEQYLNHGLESLVKDAIRGTLKNPRETAFFTRYAGAVKKAENRRRRAAEGGERIPPFLIAGVSNRCNLNCIGCYDRARERTGDCAELSRKEWRRIFSEAADIGVSIILLAGGEPLMRQDVLEEAAGQPSLLFPVFTNGMMLDSGYIPFFDKHRNVIPIISIEGGESLTDLRRGDGVYAKTMQTMEALRAIDLVFGLSITITRRNLLTATQEKTIAELHEKGCKALVLVEYVPVVHPEWALDSSERRVLEERVALLRKRREMIIISFPGDEKESGGCLAAGRGFFYISAAGDAEPCPFSPYSNTNLKTSSLREALKSPLFVRLREEGVLDQEHTGGCTLFERSGYVRSLAGRTE
jgi:MoaA/NifB/PqqE/SkfB family radical SAM enzyme